MISSNASVISTDLTITEPLITLNLFLVSILLSYGYTVSRLMYVLRSCHLSNYDLDDYDYACILH